MNAKDVLAFIKQQLVETYDVKLTEYSENASLSRDFGLDSLDCAILAVEIERKFNVSIYFNITDTETITINKLIEMAVVPKR